MSVQIIITGDTSEEALLKIAALAKGLTSGQVSPIAIPEAPKQDKPARTRQTAKPDPVKEQPPAEDEKPEATDADADENDDAGDEPIPTDVELRELATKVGAQGPEFKAKIKPLLNKYGSANITGLPEGKRVAFKRELEALA